MRWPLDDSEQEDLGADLRELVWAWTRRILAVGGGPPYARDDPMSPELARHVRLAELAMAEYVREEATAQIAAAARAAASAGADYAEIGDSLGMTRQGVRQRWPDLANLTRGARTEP